MGNPKGERHEENSCRCQDDPAILPLFFYLFLERPELPALLALGLFSFWGTALFLDMRITMSLKDLVSRHEANDVFRSLYQKFGRKAVAIQLGIEGAFVILFPSIATIRQPGQPFEIDVMGAAVLAGIVGVLHVFAWRNNKVEIQKIRKENTDSVKNK